MSGFRDHFLDKYFAYRTRYVAAVEAEKPHRVRLAVLAEVARLTFVVATAALLALVLWLLVFGSYGRLGIGVRTISFALFAGVVTYLGIRALGGLRTAVMVLRKV